MDSTIVQSTEDVNFEELQKLFESVGWRGRTEEKLRQAFAASYRVVFAYNSSGKLIGCARAVSDGVYYATIFDLAVDPKCQRQGLGHHLLEVIVESLAGMPWISLSSTPGHESLFTRFGFVRQRAALAIVQDPFSEFLDM